MPERSAPDSSAAGSLPQLRRALLLGGPDQAIRALTQTPPATAAVALTSLPPPTARVLLATTPEPVRAAILATAGETGRSRWATPADAPKDTIGAMMRPPLGVVPEEVTATEAVALVRRIASPDLTYLYPVDHAGRITGVVVFRDLFLAPADRPVRDLMVRPPFFLTPELTAIEAMRAVVGKHFPVYPVCEPDGTLMGLVRGYALFENQVVTITAQAGKLEGVRAGENVDTPFFTSLRTRFPWLALNLVLSLLSALVMLSFKPTLGRFIILAIFVSVIATQGRNSGAQTMAITLRGINSGAWNDRLRRRIALKESALGLANGAVIGAVAAGAIWLEEWWIGNHLAPQLALAVLLGMTGGCALSCTAGVYVPLALRRLGFDPALAAGILLTNISTVFCQVLFLSLAIWLVD